jgi:hypothetical protein
LCAEPAAERVRVDVIGEEPLTVDLDYRQPLPVAGFELGVARDVDLFEREAELGAQLLELLASPVAEMAPRGVVERDYG